MPRRPHNGLVTAVTAALLVTGCAHHPEIAANDHRAVDVAQEHPRLNAVAGICTERELLCILAGFAVLGGVVAAMDDD